jgi:nucleoside-diphosphate-sugar epimerase
MKKVLLIGGGGYVGTELQKHLISLGYSVRVFDTFWYTNGKWPFGSFPGHPRIEYIEGDVRNLRDIEKSLREVDSCIHLACVSNDPSYELAPELAYQINFEAFEKLIPLLNASELSRFVFASSSSVYGVKEEERVTEDLSLEPLTDYSKYKVKCEKLVLEEINSGITATILRPSTVCGYSRRQRFDLVVNILTLSALVDGIIRVDGGEQYRPNLHMNDMLQSYSLVLDAPKDLIDREIFNVAGENLTVNEIARKVKSAIGNNVRIEFLPVRDARSYRVSGEKILRVLNFQPRFTVDNAIVDIIKAYKEGVYGDTNWTQYYNLKRMKELLNIELG